MSEKRSMVDRMHRTAPLFVWMNLHDHRAIEALGACSLQGSLFYVMTMLAVFVASERRKMYQLREAHTLSQMTEQTYVREVLRTFASAEDEDRKLCLGALGLTGEAGEVADIIKKHLFQGHVIDQAKLLDEMGDVL